MSTKNAFAPAAEAARDKRTRRGAEGVAAFFDLDGTLLSLPSLEWRLFQQLRCCRLVRPANYLRWLLAVVRLAPRGIRQVLYANKMYLRGVRVSEVLSTLGDEQTALQRPFAVVRKDSYPFYSQALTRVAWHAKQGHALLIVSGTLQPLAIGIAAAIEDHLCAQNVRTTIAVYATRLETRGSILTGRIAGDAMFGEAKGRALRQIAASRRFDLEKCFAYADSANDRWMLESVGRPHAVNPSNDLARIATRNNWPILRWEHLRAGSLNSPTMALPRHRSGDSSTQRVKAGGSE